MGVQIPPLPHNMGERKTELLTWTNQFSFICYMNDLSRSELPVLTDKERLDAYSLILTGCTHLLSKGKPQEDKIREALNVLIPLTQKDPYFLAHLTSYIARHSDSHDLKVMTSFVNSLSDANGEPISPGSKYNKPNLRYISAAAVNMMAPKYVKRVAEFSRFKFSVTNHLNKSTHFPNSLRTALKKYIKYREENIEIMRGIKKAGLGSIMQNIYRLLHMSPSEEVAAILRWQQKDKDIKFDKPIVDFSKLTDLKIAKKIRKDKTPVLAIFGALSHAKKKVSPVIAVAILEQTTGNQAVILRKTFEDAGVLENKDVKKLYKEKIESAKTALDRVENISKTASAEVKKVLKKTRAKVRKEQVGEIGKVFLHLDLSPSMEPAIAVAKEKGAVIAEMVKNPSENFKWGTFNRRKEILPMPKEFVEDAFKAILYGKKCDGMTDAFLLYPDAREFGADVDVFITDGCHNQGDLSRRIKEYHEKNPDKKKPKAMVWINVFNTRGNGYIPSRAHLVKTAYEENEIPVAKLEPQALSSSALVSQAVKQAMMGPMQTIEDIMNEPLLELPKWYMAI